MRLTRLDLKAFGPFTDRVLSFDSKDPGLHIVFGENEAGKSSSLRGLKALLYGFDQTTPDNFIHNYDKLLVGGCLENRAGEQINFQRRKKRIGDIVDLEGQPLDADALSSFIPGVAPEIFESLYGIDHDALVKGGKDILEQKGEVGQALFAAGAGISSLRDVIEKLEKEAGSLFKPKGQKQYINKAIKRYRELQKAVKTASLSISNWRTLRKTLEDAQQERQHLEAERDLKTKQLHFMERLDQAIPEIAALATLEDQLEALGEVVQLHPDFAQLLEQVRRDIREAELQVDRDKARLTQLKEKRGAISLNTAILDHAAQVDDFYQRLGEYRKGQKDRPERNGMRSSLRREAARLLEQVRPDLTLDQVEALRPMLSRKKTIQSLIPQYEKIHHQLDQARKSAAAADRKHDAVVKKIKALPEAKPDQALIRSVKIARKAGDLDIRLEEGQRDVDLAKDACADQIERMGLWSGDLNALATLALPLAETVHDFDTRWGALADERRRLARERRKDAAALKRARSEMKKLTFSGDVPSEVDLIRIRDAREAGWQLLRRQWLDQEDVSIESRRYDPEQPLVEAYESKVDQADHVADRLRREADRVAQAAAWGASIEELTDALADHDRRMEKLDLQDQALRSEWAAQWHAAGISPLSPKEMGGWLTQMKALRFQVTEMSKKEHAIALDRKRRAELRQAVHQELLAVGEQGMPKGDTLGPLLIYAETVLAAFAGRRADLDKLTDRRDDANGDMEQVGRELLSAEKALAQWQGQWKKALSDLGFTHEIATVEVNDLIDAVQLCFDNLRAAEDLQKRIDGIDRDASELNGEVVGLASTVAPNLADLPLDKIIIGLQALLKQAQKDGTRHADLSEQMDALEAEIATVQKALSAANQQMNELMQMAGCEKPEALAAVIARFDTHQQLRKKISDTEAVLAKIGAGSSIEILAEQAGQVDPDELPGIIAGLKRDIDERINPEINRISQVIGEQENRLKTMDGSSQAADAAEAMEHESAGIRRFVQRYVRLKLAARILHQEIERYREEHQDPVLRIASGYFRDLTLGSFSGLRTDVDDKGNPILVGERPDKARLTVEKMSSGTRDQLYLALRLATVAWRLETSEPMPFVIDDILVNFDDDRSMATLAVLAALAKKNQIILFTHHRQIVEAVGHIKGDAPVHVHTL